MYQAYCAVFDRLQLGIAQSTQTADRLAAVAARNSVLADSGEDAIAMCLNSDYAANIEAAEALFGDAQRGAPKPP